MQEKNGIALDSAFGQEVHEGLTAFPKHLSSKYFYDEIGDKLFQDIMAMPEYYLTNCEFDILQQHRLEIVKLFASGGEPFSLFELGAGDGKKTKIVLQCLLENEVDFSYRPIDISQNALDQLENSLKKELPEVKINAIQGTYFDTLTNIADHNGQRKVILFLGSNIGNLLHPQAIEFLQKIAHIMDSEDLLFMGMDQKKNPQTILDAYNDSTGITADFNKNILRRVNTEFNGNFDLDKFLHWEVYDPETGTAKSFLVAKEKHTVYLKDLELNVGFDKWETIHTEISQKYDDKTIAWMASEAGLEIVTDYTDQNTYFKNYVLRKR